MVVLYWCFAAIANFERIKSNGLMTKTAWVLASPLVVFGFLLDFWLNLFFVSVLMLDPFHFGTVSQRMKKYNNDPKELLFRKVTAKWLEPLLDPLDFRGNHI
jgi:hypothetical protein